MQIAMETGDKESPCVELSESLSQRDTTQGLASSTP